MVRLCSRAHLVREINSEAQGWFNRGLNWCYAFHHKEAVRCFEKTVELDPDLPTLAEVREIIDAPDEIEEADARTDNTDDTDEPVEQSMDDE